MFIDLTPEQEALRTELRTYFKELLPPERKLRIRGERPAPNPEYRAVVRDMGQAGWLGIGWPKEYGGQARTAVEQYLFFEEAMAAGAPVPFLTINTVGPTLMHFGTQEQKDFFLPKILAGEMHFSIGYSEPTAGTDLAALRTRAVKDGDEWVINGQKLFTSLAWDADYIWLAARTDPDAPQHKGITMFLVPTSSPGFKIQPFITMGRAHTTATFYDDVRVPDSARVGEVNGGWRLITNQLNHERVGLAPAGGTSQLLEDTIAWARSTRLPDGRRVIDQEWVQIKLARIKAHLEFLRLINWKVAWSITHGSLNPADASATKVFGSEFFADSYKNILEIIGSAGYLSEGSPGAVLEAKVEGVYRTQWVQTFGGGTNEIQRDIIAMVGLQMPREKRRH
jgi:alkylation response protein AidB-like acyl-CoA dehydrogenase